VGAEGRFVWDYWHVPGEYTHLRTPAWLYFPKGLYQRFHQRLVWWGRRVLGCHDVSPPWLSVYVEGCEQQAHVDAPHGPWAFVYSLTRWGKHGWSGGRTFLRPSTRSARSGRAAYIAPRFNQLAVFDPRVLHGVERVRGVRDPREGRLVIHGWFVQPRPFIEGPLSTRALATGIEEVGATLLPLLQTGLEVRGMVSLGFQVTRFGTVEQLKTLTDNTVSPDERERKLLLASLRRSVSALSFSPQRAASRVTLPVVFDA
jgi:2OG-Fe(II) oxygenase superfamily